MAQKAFLFDLNGTMIDDMQFHINAWHTLLNQLGATISLEQTKAECYGKNAELLQRIFPDRFTAEEVTALSIAKETQYQKDFLPHLQLIEGLAIFLQKAQQQQIKMAIGSAAIMYNIDYILDGLNLRHYISAIVSADDVTISKPHPETFIKCAEQLQVQVSDCIVFEDSPKGVEAALKANMQCVAITTMHSKEEFASFSNIIAIVDNYNDPALQSLFN